jgi:hypothetical protein
MSLIYHFILLYSVFCTEKYKFSVQNTEYNNIKWYINDIFIEEGRSIYEVEGLGTGTHSVKVEVIKGDIIASKTWNVNVKGAKGEEQASRGDIVFYLIIIGIILAIFIVIWIFISEKNKRRKELQAGFGVTEG